MISQAHFSADERFRYSLRRTWNDDGPRLLVVMLNPSTADANKNDPTISRVIQRAQTGNFGGIVVTNLYAFRSPYPAHLLKEWTNARDVIGPCNDQVIRESAAECDTALVAWGNHVMAWRRDRKVLEILNKNCCVLALGLTSDRFPRHPLHVAYSVPLSLYRGRYAI